MINPTLEDLGKKVIYSSYKEKEYGVITSFNDYCVFVKYGAQIHSKGTKREDLTWDK